MVETHLFGNTSIPLEVYYELVNDAQQTARLDLDSYPDINKTVVSQKLVAYLWHPFWKR